MAKQFKEINNGLKDFIKRQKIFFVGTADRDGRVNVSPKGMDSLRVLEPNRVVWLNYTGSGNETAAHLLAVNRMTLMFCSFDEKPLILRLYGSGVAVYPSDEEWDKLSGLFSYLSGSRQIFDIHIEMAQTSCGYAVPFFEYKKERKRIREWIEKKGPDGISDYWVEKNQLSIDGKETGISRNPS